MQDQTQIRRRARQSKISSPAIRPETIPELARYLGITTETLSQLGLRDYGITVTRPCAAPLKRDTRFE